MGHRIAGVAATEINTPSEQTLNTSFLAEILIRKWLALSLGDAFHEPVYFDKLLRTSCSDRCKTSRNPFLARLSNDSTAPTLTPMISDTS